MSSLEDKISTGSSEVWKCLVTEKSVTLEKLLDWKRKALFYMGKAELKNKDFEESVQHLEQALALSGTGSDAAKLKELLETARKHRAAELKREKSTWSKAFKVSKAEQEAEEKQAAKVLSPAPKTSSSGSISPSAASSKATGNNAKSSILQNAFTIDVKSILGDKSGQKTPTKPTTSSTTVGFKENPILTWLVGGGSILLLAFGFVGFGNLRDAMSRLWKKY